MIASLDGRRPARDHRALRRTAPAAASRSIAGGSGLPKIPGQRGGIRSPILAGLPAGPLVPPRTALCRKAGSPLFDSAGPAGERLRSPGIPPAVGQASLLQARLDRAQGKLRLAERSYFKIDWTERK